MSGSAFSETRISETESGVISASTRSRLKRIFSVFFSRFTLFIPIFFSRTKTSVSEPGMKAALIGVAPREIREFVFRSKTVRVWIGLLPSSIREKRPEGLKVKSDIGRDRDKERIF